MVEDDGRVAGHANAKEGRYTEVTEETQRARRRKAAASTGEE